MLDGETLLHNRMNRTTHNSRYCVITTTSKVKQADTAARMLNKKINNKDRKKGCVMT